MTTIINERADSAGAGLAAVVVIIAAAAVALCAYGAISTAPQSQHSDINITVPPSTAPDNAPLAPAPH